MHTEANMLIAKMFEFSNQGCTIYGFHFGY